MSAQKLDREEKLARATAGDVRNVHFINPVSGSSRYYDATRKSIDKLGGRVIVSDHSGQIPELVAAALSDDPHTHAIVYGGDGTVFEAVNGVMRSGAAETAVLSVIPSGSGNDFSACANESGELPKGEIRRIDLVKTTCGGIERYFANMMNIGFDCTVVHETEKIRESGLIKGSAAYIAGVVKVLAQKKTFTPTVTLSGCVDVSTGEPLDDMTFEREILLTACANGRYCGGGFKGAPLASLDDGLMDVLVINDISRTRFVTLVGEYRTGTYIDGNGRIKDRFKDVVSYIKCRKMTVSGAERFCLDGEIFDIAPGEELVAEIVPQAINFEAL